MSTTSIRKLRDSNFLSDSNEDIKASFICITNNARNFLRSSEELTKGLISVYKI